VKVLPLLSILCASTALFAKVSTEPKPIEDRFAEADVVCRCEVIKIVQTNNATLVNGKLPLSDFDVSLRAIRFYKSTDHEPMLTLRLADLDPMEGTPLELNASYVLFLKKASSGSYGPVGPIGLGFAFTSAKGKTDDTTGADLQADVVESLATAASRADERSDLEFLMQFREMKPESYPILERVSQGPPSDLAVLSLEILCWSGPNRERDYPRLVSMLLAYEGKSPTWFSDLGDGAPRLGDILSLPSANVDIGDLEKLTDSAIPGIRLSGMDGIRKLHDPKTVPFLVEKLDSKDRNIQYTAVITLSEITGLNGDFGPGMGPFLRNPDMFIKIWKEWYRTRYLQ
jgi:hypothetical protein